MFNRKDRRLTYYVHGTVKGVCRPLGEYRTFKKAFRAIETARRGGYRDYAVNACYMTFYVYAVRNGGVRLVGKIEPFIGISSEWTFAKAAWSFEEHETLQAELTSYNG